MKKLLLTIFALSATTVVFGQNKVAIKTAPKTGIVLSMPENVNDTIAPSLTPGCDEGPYLSPTVEGGWVSGTNGYGDLEKAQRIAIFAPGNFYSVLAVFGDKEILGAADNVVAKIYEATSTGTVGALIATSSPVSTSNIDTTGEFTKFPFTSPIPYGGGEYFLSIVVGGNASGVQDTIGILHTDDDCGGNSAWEKWDNGTWFAFTDSSAWLLDVSLYIFAEVQAFGVGTSKNVIVKNSHKLFPNPASKNANLEYAISDVTPVNLQIVDIAGKIVNVQNLGVRTAGTYTQNLDLSGLNPGIYFYTLSTNGETRNGKFVVE